MNVADADWLTQSLVSRGWTEASEADAQIFVVTTCSVREKPEQKVYSLLGRLKSYTDRNPEAFVAVGGCVAQQIGEEFWNRFPFVRLVFGTDGTAMVPQALERLVADPALRISLLDFLDHYPEREQPEGGTVQAQAFVNIMQGCDNFCTYCIVPFTRGRQKSRGSDAVVAECEALVRRGARELTLLGQNVNSYGQDKHGDGTSFASLLERISAIPGLMRLKFTTSHPKDIAPEVVTAFGKLPNLCPQLHLPVQSGSDAVLKAMGRKYTKARYLDTIRELRRVCPQITLTTDIIVGFPGRLFRILKILWNSCVKCGMSRASPSNTRTGPGCGPRRWTSRSPKRRSRDAWRYCRKCRTGSPSRSWPRRWGRWPRCWSKGRARCRTVNIFFGEAVTGADGLSISHRPYLA